MVLYKGFNTRIQYITESAWGVQSSAVNVVLSGKLKNFNPELNNNLYRTQGLGEGRNETQTLVGNFDCKWTMELEVGIDMTFFQYLIGPKSGSGSTAAPYYLEEADQLAYTGSPMLVSFKMEVGSEAGTTDDVDTYYGNVINRTTFNFALNRPLTASIEGFSEKPLSSTSATNYTANTDKIFMFQQGTFKWGGDGVARVQSGSLTIDNKYDPEENRGLGSRFVLECQPNERTYDWTVVTKMTDTIATTLRDDFYGQANSPVDGTTDAELTSRPLILEFKEGAATGDNNLNILLSDNFIDRLSKPVAVGGGYVEVTVTGHGRKGTTDSTNKPIIWWAAT